ncbi:hypothetical protein CHL78_003250 [Romboutsia weinsteinii]|uniref:Uncharacterized protein n=1 Tax=Romboutsia weinsteinii TaxID=2020949 RepID=A0A371J862_9FIRM|nr:hypothetical protein [Romboutsia weinsteinii]RDY28952.1 hypothetical protein CHL78_003250 [Romboutsia weinsteinii]
MRNSFKLVVIVLLLIIANLYVYEGVILTKTYVNLKSDYYKLSKDYKELQDRYDEQGDYLAQIEKELENTDSSSDSIDKIKDKFYNDDISLQKIFEKFDLNKMKDFLGNFSLD